MKLQNKLSFTCPHLVKALEEQPKTIKDTVKNQTKAIKDSVKKQILSTGQKLIRGLLSKDCLTAQARYELNKIKKIKQKIYRDYYLT